MSAERELEQLRQAFAAERSALENTIAKLRRQLDEACSGEKEPPAPSPTTACFRCGKPSLGHRGYRWIVTNGAVEVCRDCYDEIQRVPESAPRPPILRCSQCDSQVGPSHWSRDGERRCEKCGPFEPRATGRCETCGTAKMVADDECSWCGPGAHKP